MTAERNRRQAQVGIDRVVRLEWLEEVAAYVLAGYEVAEIKETLQHSLKGAFRSTNANVRGSLDKTITILMKIWVRPPQELELFRQDGLELLRRLPRETHIAVHWGMTMAVYPFWGSVAMHVGRLLRLQGAAVASQVQRRVREQYGERQTVSRRVRYVLRSFVDWKVLKETQEKGVYTSAYSVAVTEPDLIGWLAEAYLQAHSDGSATLATILDSASLFPFRLGPVSAAQLVAGSARLETVRHGLDQDLIMFRPKKGPVG